MSKTTIKKKLAIVLGATANMTFALANVIMGIEKHLKNKSFDTIVYHKDISEKEQQLLNSILSCQFIDYELEPSDISSHSLNLYSVLTYSRFECFELLQKYEKVLWLDIDILIQKNLNNLIDQNSDGITLWQNDIHTKQFNFTVSIPGYDMKENFYNPGVFIISDQIKNGTEIKKWCYQKTKELGKFLVCGDQGIMNIAVEEFNIPITKLNEIYNCHPEKQIASGSFILHPYAKEKFWNYYYNFDEWNNNYKRWLQLGGSPYKGKRANLTDKFFIKFKKKYMPEAPDPRRHTGKFIKYFYDYNFKKVN